MSRRRRTKEELDEQFEQFLKESVSDDSVDLGAIPKRPSVLESLGRAYQKKPAKKPAVSVSPWWQHDDDSDQGQGTARKRRFIKVKKLQAENTEEDEREPRKSTPTQAASAELPHRPAPTPRSKAPGALVKSDNTVNTRNKCDLEASSQAAEDSHSPHSMSGCRRTPDDSSVTTSASSDTGSQYSSGDGLLGSGKTFMKSLRKSQSIQEEAEEQRPGDQAFGREERTEPALFSRDSLEAEESVMASGPVVATTSVFMDTLEEEEEKARFFAQLEAEATSSIDYSKLNRELDSTSGTNTGLTLRKVDAEEDKREDRFMETDRSCPASPHYSEDFEDEGSGKETPVEKPESPLLQAKVSLDSLLDSASGGPTPVGDKREPVDTEAVLPAGQSYVQSGGSDMEALQEAYRNISHSVEDHGDHQHRRGSPESSHSVEDHGDHQHRRGSPERSGSPPERTLQRASTMESELPTAEELMRPIRPEMEHIRGFTLQPATGVEVYPEEADIPSERRSPGHQSPEQRSSREPVSAVGGRRREAGGPSSPPGPGPPPLQALTWNIREEMERLMQDQEDGPASPGPSSTQDQEDGAPPGPSSTQASREKKQQPRGGPSLSGPPTSSARKPSVAPPRGRRVEGRPTTASRFSRPGSAGTSSSLAPQRKPQAPRQASHRSPGPKPKPTEKTQEVQASRELIAFLQQQIDTGSIHIPAATQDTRVQQESIPTNHATEKNMEPREQEEEEAAEEERSLLRAQLAQKDQELLLREEQLKQRHNEELSSLRQENFVLQSKLHSVEDAEQKRRCWGEAADPVTQEKLRLLEKEMREQETLIQGYQQENEKLYLQMKGQQAKTKANEEAMFTENQRLLIQLALAKEQLHQTPRPVGNVCSMGHTQRITELLAQLETVQRNEAKLTAETHSLQREKRALEEDLQLMKKERELARTSTQLCSTSGDKGAELRTQEDRHRAEMSDLQKKQEDRHRAEMSDLQKKQEDRHRAEMSDLQKKLHWYAENQELLDRDAARLRAATAQTHKLKEQVEKLRSEVGRRGQQQQTKARERAADAKRIQDLERQVKELEQTLRRRHPNSLPALIHAAAAAACGPPEETQQQDHPPAAAKPCPPSQVHALLERRIQRLEAELESCDEEAKRGLRAMDQQFQRIKLQYEHQISELEQQLQAQKKPPSEAVQCEPSPPEAHHQVQTLELERELVKQAHRSTEQALRQQLRSLQQQLSEKQQAQPPTEPERVPRSPSRHQRQAEEAVGVRIERLNQELSVKTRSIQELSRTVERLQKERCNLLSGPSPRRADARRASPHSNNKTPLATAGASASARPGGGEEEGGVAAAGGEETTFPVPAQCEKAYRPTEFSGSHISEVLQENQALRQRLEQLRMHTEQRAAELQADASQAHAQLGSLKEHSAEQLSILKADHQRELQQLCASHALEHSRSKVAELTNKLAAQEVALQQLGEQVKESQGTRDALALSRLREDTLQNQLTRLLGELKQAKESHSPELKHFLCLESKIHSMALRHTQREKELQQLVSQTRQTASGEQQTEAEQRWRLLAQSKSRELEAFRRELDSILDILRELQRQGVVIPTAATGGVPFTWKS